MEALPLPARVRSRAARVLRWGLLAAALAAVTWLYGRAGLAFDLANLWALCGF
jgi:hypothetical protein